MNCRSDKVENSRLIHGRYRTLRLVGQGGIARICLCQDTLAGRPAALKIPLDDSQDSAGAIRSEFAFGMTHRHPALVNPTALVADGRLPAMVMPYVEGEAPSVDADGRSFFRAHPEYPPGPAIAAMLEAAAFIHFAGYIYNDFKPSNFIFQTVPGNDGASILAPRLLDFNLVSGIGEAVTRKGTIEYAAPEVLLGHPATPLSDCYSLGATLYELFAGQPPFVCNDGPRLIKLITENGGVDMRPAPEEYREGLGAMLARRPEDRPADMLAAARALGVDGVFEELLAANFGRYLSSGAPPFAAELKRAVSDYIKGRPEKALLIRGLGPNFGDLDYLTVHMNSVGWGVERIGAGVEAEEASKVLDLVLAEESSDSGCRTLVLVEDFAGLSPGDRQRLRSLLRPSKWRPVIIGGRRWAQRDFPCQVFDPVIECSHHAATQEALKALLKKEPDFEYSEFAAATGGEPEQAHHLLRSAAQAGSFDIFSKTLAEGDRFEPVSEIETILEDAMLRLQDDQRDTLGFLAAWGESVPMILLAGFEDARRDAVDSLVGLKFLKTEKGLLIFSSGNLRQFAYGRMPQEVQRACHQYWAKAAEKYLTDDEGLIEIMANHWGRSGDSRAGYEANLAAAREFFKQSDLGRARACAETLLELARAGGGPIAQALMLSADIAKQAGDYPSARAGYIELLRHLRRFPDNALEAEVNKDLGDLYRSQKKPAKALAYIRRARGLFEGLGNAQGVADCHNNIGLILWVGQEHEKALESFFSALELNKCLGNFYEQANISSNIGIIKDILGKSAEALSFFESAYFNAQQSADPRLEARIANNLGYFYLRQDKLSKATDYFHESLRISERIGYTESVINCLGNLGLCNLKAGDLFASIEYSQKAIRMAEEIGNRHLALDSKLFMVEVCILMGNFTLADRVLGSIERDPVYSENRGFACQVDILRARLWRQMGIDRGQLRLATRARDYAAAVGDLRLRFEAALLEARLETDRGALGAVDRLPEIAAEAAALGHYDIADEAALALGWAHYHAGGAQAAEARVESVYGRPGQTRRLQMEAGNLLGLLRAGRGRYDDALTILMENESGAVGAGFLPLGMAAAAAQAEVLAACGKDQKAREALSRARAYLGKIASSLPPGVSEDDYLRGPGAEGLFKFLREMSDKECVSVRGGIAPLRA